jgi:hypothetical protein
MAIGIENLRRALREELRLVGPALVQAGASA